MEKYKNVFCKNLLEYSHLPQEYDREKFILSGTKYNSILKCLETAHGGEITEEANFKH